MVWQGEEYEKGRRKVLVRYVYRMVADIWNLCKWL